MKLVCPVCQCKEITKTIYLYGRCRNCSLLYLLTMPTAGYLNKAVQNFGEATKDERIEEKTKVIYEERLRDLAEYLKPKATILDVGCGNGIFVRVAKKAGYTIEAMDKARACVQTMKSLGVSAYSDLSQVPDNTYDAITLFDVIEHIGKPKQFLDLLHKKLKKNGVLMITTPNASGITSKLKPSLLTLGTPDGFSEHVVLFTMSSLTYALKANFSPIATKTDIMMNWCYLNPILLRKILNKVVYVALTPVMPYLFSRDLGDNLQIIARKTSV